MSSSDWGYSIDWLAGDEDDYSSPKRASPRRPEEPLETATSSSPTSSLRESPTSCLHRGAARRRRRRRTSCEGDAASPVAAGPGFDSQQMLSAESKLHSSRKRTHGAGRVGLCGKPQADTEHEILSQKWPELQCYVQPLWSILRGLRSGRYSERLSSFQESVAMDRLQRIMGVLQNPNMGRRFLSMILTIEKMLHRWFPHVRVRPTQTDDSPPVKRQKHHSGASSPPPSSSSSDVEMYASIRLKCLHLSPTRSLKTPGSTPGRRGASTSPLAAIQDNTVSSSTERRVLPRRRHAADPAGLARGPPPFNISSPCLEGLLHAKQSVVTPRRGGGGGGGGC